MTHSVQIGILDRFPKAMELLLRAMPVYLRKSCVIDRGCAAGVHPGSGNLLMCESGGIAVEICSAPRKSRAFPQIERQSRLSIADLDLLYELYKRYELY